MTFTDAIVQCICDKLALCEVYDIDGGYMNRAEVKRMITEAAAEVEEEFAGGKENGSI